MSLVIEETFRVQAEIERVWRYLVDPSQVVACVPGAALTSVEPDRTFKGRVKAKVGPVTTSYAGVARLTEQDDVAHTLTLVAEGKEVGGSGSARFTMRAVLQAISDGGVEVHVMATVDIVGRVMQFGRGMVEMVARQLFADFVNCVRATLEQPVAEVQVLPAADVQVLRFAQDDIAPQREPAPMRPMRSLMRGMLMRLRAWLTRKRRT